MVGLEYLVFLGGWIRDFRVSTVTNSSCRCGANRGVHFFFECPNYSNIRRILFNDLNWLHNDCTLDLKLLNCGN